MHPLLEIPEVQALDHRGQLVRIPPELDVPLTPRVRALVDTPAFQRLAHVTQLGLVRLVYPAAHHTRFEHSLGVYRLGLLYLRRLAHDPRFQVVSPQEAEVFLVAALLHDLGHWPFCHWVEEMDLPGVPEHELFANSFLLESEVADVLLEQWNLQPRQVVTLLSQKPRTRSNRILASMLSGPIDIDKMDYLFRDSLHAGVPYGRNFDQARLIGSLCLNRRGDALAVTEKGKTAAELMVFARYVMFSEVYWHHAVRAATAMFQRAFYNLYRELDLDHLFRQREPEMVEQLLQASQGRPEHALLMRIFGPRRQLFKRVAQFSYLEHPLVYRQLAHRPYRWSVEFAVRFAELARRKLGRDFPDEHLLLDTPPVRCEVQFDVEVYYPKQDCYRPLEQVSPVVRTLAREQFDDYVKRVRIFAERGLAQQLRELPDLVDLVLEAAEAAES